MNMITKTDDFIKRVESTAEEDFFTPRTFYHLSSSMFHEMCELLKEQEAVKPIEKNGFYYCGSCRYALMTNRQKYCSNCGKAVKCNDELHH